jgi:hypothetical protein
LSVKKTRFALWIRDEDLKLVQDNYRRDNCKTQSEYIEKAVRFYSGYLNTESDGAYLPRVLSATLEGALGVFGDRIGKLLYKQIVEQSILTHIIAADTDIDEQTLDKLRGRCVRDVNRTNGQITFKDILRFQKGL